MRGHARLSFIASVGVFFFLLGFGFFSFAFRGLNSNDHMEDTDVPVNPNNSRSRRSLVFFWWSRWSFSHLRLKERGFTCCSSQHNKSGIFIFILFKELN